MRQNKKQVDETWLETLRSIGVEPNKNSRICSDHFKECDFQYNCGVKKVKNGVVPSRFENIVLKSSQTRYKMKSDMVISKEAALTSQNRSETKGTKNASESDSTKHTDEHFQDGQWLSFSQRPVNASMELIASRHEKQGLLRHVALYY